MLRLARDADVHGEIVRGLRRRQPDLDLIRVQDALAKGTADEDVLAWTALENRVLITNDRSTMIGIAWNRVARGGFVAGLIVTTNAQSIGAAINDVLLVAACMSQEEMKEKVVVYLPLR